MNEQQLKEWCDTAIYVEQERIRMLREVEKENRRERIATALMAGMYANPAHAEIDDKMAALCAIDGADALIKALDQKENKDANELIEKLKIPVANAFQAKSGWILNLKFLKEVEARLGKSLCDFGSSLCLEEIEAVLVAVKKIQDETLQTHEDAIKQ